jgi:hypothetical protein
MVAFELGAIRVGHVSVARTDSCFWAPVASVGCAGPTTIPAFSHKESNSVLENTALMTPPAHGREVQSFAKSDELAPDDPPKIPPKKAPTPVAPDVPPTATVEPPAAVPNKK